MNVVIKKTNEFNVKYFWTIITKVIVICIDKQKCFNSSSLCRLWLIFQNEKKNLKV